MFISFRSRDNWIRVRGRIAEDPQLTTLPCGTEVCSLAVQTMSAEIPVRAAHRAARRAIALSVGEPIEVVGRMLVQRGAKDSKGWSGIQAAAVRAVAQPRRGAWRWVRLTGAILAGFLLLVSWPGAFWLSATLSVGLWGLWNAWFVFANPQCPGLKLRHSIRWVTAVVVLSCMAAAVIQLAPSH